MMDNEIITSYSFFFACISSITRNVTITKELQSLASLEIGGGGGGYGPLIAHLGRIKRFPLSPLLSLCMTFTFPGTASIYLVFCIWQRINGGGSSTTCNTLRVQSYQLRVSGIPSPLSSQSHRDQRRWFPWFWVLGVSGKWICFTSTASKVWDKLHLHLLLLFWCWWWLFASYHNRMIIAPHGLKSSCIVFPKLQINIYRSFSVSPPSRWFWDRIWIWSWGCW